MAATCDVYGKGPGFGMSVSHSHRRTRRRWNPNIQTVRALVGPDRVLFGSDWPYVPPEEVGRTLAAATAGLPAADRDALAGGNARRLFPKLAARLGARG